MKRLLLSLLFFAGLLLLWEMITRLRIWSPVLLPAPIKVWEYLQAAAADGTLWQAIWITVKRLLIGYLIGLIGGVPLGLLTARWRVLHDTVGTLALGLQTLPSVCWVPLALLWFGQSEAAMLFVVVMGTLWSVVIATDTHVRLRCLRWVPDPRGPAAEVRTGPVMIAMLSVTTMTTVAGRMCTRVQALSG